MSQTILEIPVSAALKKKAEKASRFYGFANLQDALQQLIHKLSAKELSVTPKEEVVHLSKRAEKRYAQMDEDFKTGKNIYHAKNKEEFFKLLRS